jgi:HAE1 family hydrophobic/amphiphilic exporter-1
MLPLAIGTGPGAEERRSIAIVVIGGQTLSLLLTLIATPVAYSLLDDLRSTSHWRSWSAAGNRVTTRLRGLFKKPAPADAPNETLVSHRTSEPEERVGAAGGD